MNSYEITFLVNETADAKIVKESITALEGKITSEKEWGERTLAYPINKKTSALYYTWNLSIDNSKLNELKQKLNFNDKIVRYLLIKSEE